jgi:hypothetical protein
MPVPRFRASDYLPNDDVISERDDIVLSIVGKFDGRTADSGSDRVSNPCLSANSSDHIELLDDAQAQGSRLMDPSDHP